MSTVAIYPDKSERILSGWKDIANYLHKGVRTVQRYEQELKLPVRRPAAKSGGSVLAMTNELDAWVRAVESRNSAERLNGPAAAATEQRSELKVTIQRMVHLCRETSRLRTELGDSREKFCDNLQFVCQTFRNQRVT